MKKLDAMPGKDLAMFQRDPDLLVTMLQGALADADRERHRVEQMRDTLHAAKEQITALREEVDKLSAPPATYGTFQSGHDDGTATVLTGGRKLKVHCSPRLAAASLRPGQEVLLNDALNVIEAAGFEGQGEVAVLKDRLDAHRALVTLRADEERVAQLAAPLQALPLRPGDHLLFDPRSGYVLERLPKSEVEDLVLEEVPDVTYGDIGGLDKQIEQIQDALELPYAYADYFREHKLAPPKGVLLYGPPGCGKTLIAKAVANSLAKRLAERIGKPVQGYFLNVKGPELLNKYVGETERKIREIFARAREKASAGAPVVIFFDEMESLFRTRGSGISSDIESTIVPQFLAELDGVEGLTHVIVVGASNRQDLIDPAVLRPGRFDVKIRVERPDHAAAKDIFGKYLTVDLPLAAAEVETHGGDRAATMEALIVKTTEAIYATTEDRRFLEITYASGEKETLYFKDFVSGALIQGVCTRAKKLAVKRMIQTGQKGLLGEDLLAAVQEEFQANEDLPNTTNPDDWAKIAGRRGERVVNVRVIRRTEEKARAVKAAPAGLYL
jgi:proteasome-associated ATPase